LVKVAVLDSMVNIFHPIFKEKKVINCINYTDINSEKNTYHGTAVCGIITQIAPAAIIECFPIFNEYYEAEPQKVIAVLQYILESRTYDIVNMSMGFFDPCYKNEINNVCSKLKKANVILVASFDNWGSMSYPACLDSVIGVDISNEMDVKKSFYYNDIGCVNVIYPNKQRYVAWGNGEYRIVRGTSFAAAELTGHICKYLMEMPIKEISSIADYLSMKSAKVVEVPHEESNIRPAYCIVKAAIFPYCKETVTIVKSMDYLCCEIVGLYDYRLSNHIGISIETLNKNKKIIVESDKKIPWDEIDTLIVGYTVKNNIEINNVFYKILGQAEEHNVNIYSLDALPSSFIYKKTWYPQVNYSFLPKTQQGKLWAIDKPVIAVLGTHSRMGKFTTQIKLSKAFHSLSYEVGMISTEPTGYLFGADYVFPYGYNSTVDISTEEYCLAINKMMNNMPEKKEIITLSLQGGVLHLNHGNINQLSIKQHAILFGAFVDIAILCVSIDDDDELIQSTINYLSACFNILTICILIYPIVYRGIYNDDPDLKEVAVPLHEMRNKEQYYSTQFKCVAMEMNNYNIQRAARMIIKELLE